MQTFGTPKDEDAPLRLKHPGHRLRGQPGQRGNLPDRVCLFISHLVTLSILLLSCLRWPPECGKVQRYAAENGSVSIIRWNVRLGSAQHQAEEYYPKSEQY